MGRKQKRRGNQQWRVWCEESGGWEYQKRSGEYGRACIVEDSHRDKMEQWSWYIYTRVYLPCIEFFVRLGASGEIEREVWCGQFYVGRGFCRPFVDWPVQPVRILYVVFFHQQVSTINFIMRKLAVGIGTRRGVCGPTHLTYPLQAAMATPNSAQYPRWQKPFDDCKPLLAVYTGCSGGVGDGREGAGVCEQSYLLPI